MADFATDTDQQQVPQPPKKLKVSEFAAKVKVKYPEYKDLADDVLVDKIIAKYPQYKTQVDIPVKKNETPSPPPSPSDASGGKSGLQEPPKKFTTSVVFPELDNQAQTVQEADPIALAKQADALSKETVETNTGGAAALMGGVTSQRVPKTESVNKANEIYGNLEKLGYNGKKLAKDFDGIPDFVFNQQEMTKPELLDDYKNNPQLYERKIATAKWQTTLTSKLKELQSNPDLAKDATIAYKDAITAANNLDIDGDYTSQRNFLQQITNVANKFGGDKKDDILRNLGIDISYIYGKAASDPNFIMQNAGSKLNNLQAVATNYLQDIHPEELRKYTSAFLKDEDIKDNDNAKLAKEEALKRLEEIGINLNKSYLQEKLNPIKKEYDILWDKSQSEKGLSVEELDRAKQLEELGAPYQSQLENVNSDEQQLLERYPNASYYDVNQFSQELLGQKYNWGTHALMKVGEAMENTGAGVYDFVASPFRSKSEDEIRQADVLGEGIKGRNLSYVTGISGKPVLSDALKSDIDKIKNDKLLSDDQKAKEVNQLLMKRNGEWYKDPESHLSLKSLAYGITDMAAGLVPFIGLEMITGGGATAGVVRKFTSSFISAAATSFEDSYRNGIEKGVKNPYAYATRVTAINSAAIAGAGTASEIRAMFSKQKTPIGDLVMKMSDSEIEAALKEAPKSLKTLKGTLEAARDKAIGGVRSISKDAVSSFKEAAKINAAMSAGNITNDAISGELKSPVEYGKDFLLESLKFGIFGTAMRTGTKIIRPSDMSMAALYEAGANKDVMLSHLDEKIKSGEITQSEGQEIKRNIEDVSKIIKKHSEVLSILHDKQKREYLYNALKEQRSRNMAEALPEKQAEKYDTDAESAKFKNSYLIEPKTPEQLEKRKAQLEKSLIPEKDADGKNIEIPQQEVLAAKAEMQAIDEVLEEHKKANEVIEATEPTKDTDALIQEAKDSGKLGVFKNMENEALLKMVAEQAQNLDAKGKEGKPEEAEMAMNGTVNQFGKELVDAAIAKYPKPKVEGIAPPKVTEGSKEVINQIGDLTKDSLLKKLIEINAPKELIDRINKESKILDYKDATIKEWVKSNGYYQWGSNDIHINPLMKLMPNKRDNVIIHESIHLVTHDTIQKYIEDNYSGIKLSTIETLDFLNDTLNKLKSNFRGVKKPYGFTNLHEFVAEFISNESFRNTVARNLDGNKSTLNKILDAIKDFYSTVTGLSIKSSLNVDELSKINKEIESIYENKRGENKESEQPISKDKPLTEGKVEDVSFEYKKTYTDKDNEDGAHPIGTYDLKVNGEDAGILELHEYPDKGFRFSSVDLNENLRNKGIGKDLYKDINKKSVEETGHPLWAKKEQLNENSERVWKSLVKSGDAITTEYGYKFKEQTKVNEEAQAPEVLNPKEEGGTTNEGVGILDNIISEREKLKGNEGIVNKTAADIYNDISQIKTEKLKKVEKEKLIRDNFDGMVAQLKLKNKLKVIC